MAIEILLPTTEETKVVVHIQNEEVEFDLADLIALVDEAYDASHKSNEKPGVIFTGLFNSRYENHQLNIPQAIVLMDAIWYQMDNFKKKSLILPSSSVETVS